MAKLPKTEEIKVRVSAEMKQQILELTHKRDIGESLLVREALAEYLVRQPSDQRALVSPDAILQSEKAKRRRTKPVSKTAS